MKLKTIPKLKRQYLFLLIANLTMISEVNAQTYDFKAENDDHVTIYYRINDQGASVTAGDEEYSGIIRIPEKITYNGSILDVTSISEKAFYYCQSLESIELPNSVTKISDNAFYECSGLKTVIIPENVSFIGNYAFEYCKSLELLEFPKSLTSIGQFAFNGCSKLTAVNIPANVNRIGKAAFANSPALNSITVDSNNAVYDSRENCNSIIETATNTLIIGCKNSKIPTGVSFVGDMAFYYCQSLESIELPNSVTKISDNAFYECSGLKTVIIPENVSFIGNYAFEYCKSLELLEFPKSLTSIGQFAFNGCSKLTAVNIPANVNRIGKAAFANSPALNSITVDSNNAVYDSRENCNSIIETATNTLIIGCKNSKIPTGVSFVGDMAFYYCQSLESIELSNSVTGISDNAFYGCSGLKTVNIPEKVNFIGNYAFALCNNLNTIKSSILTPFEIGNSVFDQSTKNTATLKVPKGTKATYLSTTGWEFINIEEESSGDDNNDDNNDESNSEISLVVWAKDGSKVAFALSKKPKVIFTATDLQIRGKDIDVTYALDNMARFTYEKVDIDAIKDIKTEKVAFKFTGESLLFPALKANSTVWVYSLNGTLVFKKTVQAAGEYSFPISNLSTGVYFVSVNGLTYKIVKR